MIRSNTAIFLIATAIYTSSGVAQTVDIAAQLKTCAIMTDQNSRLACFDDLGERVLREEPVDEKPTQENKVQPEAITETEVNAEPLPEDLGKSKDVQYRGLITSCKKGHYDDWYFIFDNGQVWKQISGRNRRFKECNFHATITKDAFGYKMRVDGIQGVIRVRRN